MTDYHRHRVTGKIDQSAEKIVNYEDIVLADSPVAFWPMQEASGDLVDVVAARNAVLTGTSTVTYSQSGPGGMSSVEFPGTGGTHFSVNDNDVWSPDSLSAEAWLYLSGDWGAGQRFWGSKHAGSGAYSEWLGLIYNPPSFKSYNQITTTSATSWRLVNASVSITQETWHYMVFTYDNSTTTLTTYLDGNFVASDNTGSGTRRGNSSGQLNIGYLQGTGGTEAWKGRISHFAFYDYVLTSTQISNHYSAM